jgi:putative flippase GtrA
MGVNFGLNRVFAFRSRSLVGSAFGKYLLLVGLNYVSTLLLVTGLAAAGVSYVLAKTLATGFNAICNYIAYRYWVFKS